MRLEARHRHVLVDEFQDTSRAQWELVLQLIRSWGEGFGAAADAIAPSIFVVGDRKQSIYGFRDADVSVVDDAAAFIESLRPEGNPRQAITVSFRSDPAILAFVNDVFTKIAGGVAVERPDGFRYDERDRFRCAGCGSDADGVTFISGETVHAAAEKVAAEIIGLIDSETVRDPRLAFVARRGRPTSPSCSARATVIAISNRPSIGAAFQPMSTRVWGSRRG